MTMKNVFIAALCCFLAAGCEKPLMNDGYSDGDGWSDADGVPAKKFIFTVKGDFGSASFTRGYLQADGQDMTDLWVWDFMDGLCVQSVHQTSADADFGRPVMRLAYGEHHVYFVASRGVTPSVDDAARTIVWDKVRDTFWKDYDVNVVSTSNGNRAVTLDRVVTKARLTVDDEVPAGCASVTVTPAEWYYGIDYTTGSVASVQQKDVVISVPSSYAGTSGQLVVSVFGISGASEWITDVTLKAKDASGGLLGQAEISGAPFMANRVTEYSGSLFSDGCTMSLGLSDGWLDPVTGTW